MQQPTPKRLRSSAATQASLFVGMQQMSTSIDGVAYLQQSPAEVMAALVQLISRGPPVAALLPATACIAGEAGSSEAACCMWHAAWCIEHASM